MGISSCCGEAINLNPILHFFKLAIYSSFKKLEVITNTKRRDSLPAMAHQLVGANFLLRARNRKLVSSLLQNFKDSGDSGRGAVRRTGKLRAQLGLWSNLVFEAKCQV